MIDLLRERGKPWAPGLSNSLELTHPILLFPNMSSLAHPSTQGPPAGVDLEKHNGEILLDEKDPTLSPVTTAALPFPSKLGQLNARIESLAGLEARGIVRVEENERHGISWLGYLQMAIMWYSANITANNLAVGLLGPLVFGLGFKDSALMACFGSLVGSAFTAYMSIWGAQSGNRTMVRIRSDS